MSRVGFFENLQRRCKERLPHGLDHSKRKAIKHFLDSQEESEFRVELLGRRISENDWLQLQTMHRLGFREGAISTLTRQELAQYYMRRRGFFLLVRNQEGQIVSMLEASLVGTRYAEKIPFGDYRMIHGALGTPCASTYDQAEFIHQRKRIFLLDQSISEQGLFVQIDGVFTSGEYRNRGLGTKLTKAAQQISQKILEAEGVLYEIHGDNEYSLRIVSSINREKGFIVAGVSQYVEAAGGNPDFFLVFLIPSQRSSIKTQDSIRRRTALESIGAYFPSLARIKEGMIAIIVGEE